MASRPKPRVLVVAQSALARRVVEALEPMFASESVESHEAAQARFVPAGRFTACIVDYELQGATLIERLRDTNTGLPLLLVTSTVERTVADAAARLAVPLVLWPFDAPHLADVLRSIERSALGFVEYKLRETFDANAERAKLTPQQGAVSWMSVLGATAKQVADSRGVAVRTVESQRLEVLKKFQVATTDELRWQLLARVLPDWRRRR